MEGRIMSVRVRVQGKIVEQFTCDCPHCKTQEHDGDYIDVDMVLEVDHRHGGEHEAEAKLFDTFVKFNDWESFYWETIEVTVLT